MQLSRRLFLACSPAALAGCTLANQIGITTAMTDAQVLADASGIVNQLSALVPNISQIAPKILTPANASAAAQALALAKGLLAGLSVNTQAKAGASTLLTVEGYVNQVLDALAGVAPAAAVALPVLAPFVLVIEAAAALLPAVETFINRFIPAPTTVASLRALVVAPTMGPAAARIALGVPTVK